MYVKVYNQILEYGLSTTQLKVYIYLTHCANVLGAATVRTITIMDRCAISSKDTVRKALAELENRGLIASKKRFGKEGHRITTQYQIAALRGRWFVLPINQGTFVMSKRTFAVWLYLKSKANRSGRAFPSLSLIAQKLNVCRQTIIDAIKDLVAGGWIIKAREWAGKHNLYALQLDSEPLQAQKKSTAAMLCSNVSCSTSHVKAVNNTSIIARAIKSVKYYLHTFLSWVGSLKNSPQ